MFFILKSHFQAQFILERSYVSHIHFKKIAGYNYKILSPPRIAAYGAAVILVLLIPR